jgi:hypothetical protein
MVLARQCAAPADHSLVAQARRIADALQNPSNSLFESCAIKRRRP